MVDERTEQDILHHLIDVCENGALGFTTAADHVKNSPLKTLFKEFSAERARFAEELMPPCSGWEGEPTTAARAPAFCTGV